jgi:DNA-binding protein Fis
MSPSDVIAHEVRRMVAAELDREVGPRTLLYAPVMAAAEKPLLEAVLKYRNFNQVDAARALGINRNTLRKKMRAHGIKA